MTESRPRRTVQAVKTAIRVVAERAVYTAVVERRDENFYHGDYSELSLEDWELVLEALETVVPKNPDDADFKRSYGLLAGLAPEDERPSLAAPKAEPQTKKKSNHSAWDLANRVVSLVERLTTKTDTAQTPVPAPRPKLDREELADFTANEYDATPDLLIEWLSERGVDVE